METERTQVGLRDEPLATGVLPPLLQRITASTERLRALAASLEQPSLGALAAEPACVELAAEAREADTLGWLLGCVAGGLGSELLLDRHEPRAIALALELVAEALAAQGLELEVTEVPEVTPQGGWRLAWALAGLVWRTGRGLAPGERLVVSFGSEGATARTSDAGATGAAVAARASDVARELEGTRLERHAQGWCWRFPSGWLGGCA